MTHLVSSLLSSVSTHHQEEQKEHQGNEIHTNIDKFAVLTSSGFINPRLPPAKANFCKLFQCWLEFLTIQDSLVYHVPFLKQPSQHQITDLSNAMINLEILLLRGCHLLVADTPGLGNIPDALEHVQKCI